MRASACEAVGHRNVHCVDDGPSRSGGSNITGNPLDDIDIAALRNVLRPVDHLNERCRGLETIGRLHTGILFDRRAGEAIQLVSIAGTGSVLR